MSTNITITSDDLNKSEVLGDLIVKALQDGGFTEVKPTFKVGFMITDPILEKLGLIKPEEEKSALDILRNAYPDFLREPINVRAIKVEGLDVNGYEDEDEDRSLDVGESARRTKGVNEYQTSIHIFEARERTKDAAERRAKDADQRRAGMHAIVNDTENQP